MRLSGGDESQCRSSSVEDEQASAINKTGSFQFVIVSAASKRAGKTKRTRGICDYSPQRSIRAELNHADELGQNEETLSRAHYFKRLAAPSALLSLSKP